MTEELDWLEICFDIMNDYLPPVCDNQKAVSEFAIIVEHAISIATYFRYKALLEYNIYDIIKASDLYEKIGENSDDCAMYERAFENYRESLLLRQKYLGEMHSKTATVLDNIGLSYTKTAHYPEAIEYHKKAISIFEKTKGIVDKDTAIAYNNLGLALVKKGDYKESIKWYRKCL